MSHEIPFNQWLVAQESGQPRSPETLCKGCPELLEALRRDISFYRWLQRALGPQPQQAAVHQKAHGVHRQFRTYRSGDRIGRYQLSDPIDKGGQGTVWRAWDPLNQCDIALKLAHPDRSDIRKSLEEATLAKQVSHPIVVRVLDVGESNDCIYIAYDLVEGESLARRIEHSRPSPYESASIVAAVADGLEAIHQLGLIHRDVKPENILLTSSGRPRLTDLGIAISTPAIMRQSHAPAGTLPYMSPEQAQGDAQLIGEWSDVYSLAAVFYHLLVGQVPLQGRDPSDTRRLICERPVARLPVSDEVPEPLAQICLKGLNKKPDDRYKHAIEMADALRTFLDRTIDRLCMADPSELSPPRASPLHLSAQPDPFHHPVAKPLTGPASHTKTCSATRPDDALASRTVEPATCNDTAREAQIPDLVTDLVRGQVRSLCSRSDPALLQRRKRFPWFRPSHLSSLLDAGFADSLPTLGFVARALECSSAPRRLITLLGNESEKADTRLGRLLPKLCYPEREHECVDALSFTDDPIATVQKLVGYTVSFDPLRLAGLMPFDRSGGVIRHSEDGLLDRCRGKVLLVESALDLNSTMQAVVAAALDGCPLHRLGDVSTGELYDTRFIFIIPGTPSLSTLKRHFRPSLWHHVSSSLLCPPPLRQRRTDLLHLLRFYAERACDRHTNQVLSTGALVTLCPTFCLPLIQHDWPEWPADQTELKEVMESAIDWTFRDPALWNSPRFLVTRAALPDRFKIASADKPLHAVRKQLRDSIRECLREEGWPDDQSAECELKRLLRLRRVQVAYSMNNVFAIDPPRPLRV